MSSGKCKLKPETTIPPLERPGPRALGLLSADENVEQRSAYPLLAGMKNGTIILEGNFDGYLQIFTATLFIIVKTWKHPRYPSAGEYGAVEYLDNEILCSAKIKWIIKP